MEDVGERGSSEIGSVLYYWITQQKAKGRSFRRVRIFADNCPGKPFWEYSRTYVLLFEYFNICHDYCPTNEHKVKYNLDK